MMTIRDMLLEGAGVSETPLAWFNLAHAYLHDAAVLKAAPKPSGGFYEEFLYFHSIKLFLKAYLRLQGIEKSELGRQPYSHRLTNLADVAERRGLVIGKRIRLVCDAARDFDKPTEARYIKTGHNSQVPAHKLHEAARELQSRVEEALYADGIPLRRPPGSQLFILRVHSRSPRRQSCSRVGMRSPDKAVHLAKKNAPGANRGA
ncbi:hypothetical protein ACD578_28245 (plasmid) [Microvirga sp. RSM25]|uniref:hypothetical protein n=1 Tax=Microvirga sp. RSM25 TaxID=3273802 RepID=UPI00384CCA8C